MGMPFLFMLSNLDANCTYRFANAADWLYYLYLAKFMDQMNQEFGERNTIRNRRETTHIGKTRSKAKQDAQIDDYIPSIDWWEIWQETPIFDGKINGCL